MFTINNQIKNYGVLPRDDLQSRPQQRHQFVSARIEPIGWAEKGSLPGNNRTALDYTPGPMQSERDLSLVFRFTSCGIFDQERSGCQTPEWSGRLNVRCRWDYQSKGPLAMELKVQVGNILQEVKNGVNLQIEER